MESEFNIYEKESLNIKEQENFSQRLWYSIVALLVILLIGWYGYSAGWFSQNNIANQITPVINEEIFGDRTVTNPAPIDSLEIKTSEGFPVQETLIIKGTLPNGCVFVNEPVQFRDGNIFYVTVDTYTEGEICTQAEVPYEKQVVLQTANLPAGAYVVNVNGTELSFELESDNLLDFEAGRDK
jgi:uncharacterized protein (UPF0333 family)